MTKNRPATSLILLAAAGISVVAGCGSSASTVGSRRSAPTVASGTTSIPGTTASSGPSGGTSGATGAGITGPTTPHPTPTQSSAPVPTRAGVALATGVVHGRVVRGPGMDPRSGGPGGTAQIPVGGDPVSAKDAQGTVRATAVSAPDGTFTLSVVPGTYTVVEDITATAQQVVVAGEGDVNVTLVIPSA